MFSRVNAPDTASRRSLTLLSALAGESLRIVGPATGTHRPGLIWLAAGDHHVAHLAGDRAGADRLIAEAAGRQWASALDVATPIVVSAGHRGSSLLSRRVVEHTPGGAAYIDALVDVADRFGRAPSTPSSVPVSTWRASARGRVHRVARALSGPLPVAEFRSVRAAVASLPVRTPGHGDLHTGNTLWDAGTHTLHVVDFEFAGYIPAGLDHVAAWVDLDDPDDRDALLDRVVEERSITFVRQISVLLRWVALRHLADLTTASAEIADPERVRRAEDLVREARQRSRDLATGTGLALVS